MSNKRKLPVSPNSIKHHVLWEISILPLKLNDIAKKTETLTSAAKGYTAGIIRQLLEDKLIKSSNSSFSLIQPFESALWATTELGSQLIRDIGRPHYTKRQTTANSASKKLKLLLESPTSPSAISVLPPLTPSYLAYTGMALRPGALDFQKIPSLR